jgi:hypothetical protein
MSSIFAYRTDVVVPWIINTNVLIQLLTLFETQHFTIIKINWLMLFKEIIAVYRENHTRPINKDMDFSLLTLKVYGTFSYH